MNPKEFLSYILPEGLVVIAELAGRGFKHHVFETLEAAEHCAASIDRAGKDCYFGLGTLREKRVWNPDWKDTDGIPVGKWEVRTGKNIEALKSLFVDMDVEPGNSNKYESQEEALQSIDSFCAATSFPPPLVTSSGGGLHCYWPFTKSIAAEQWRPVAASFKAALQKHGLKFDPSRTADASSVLRVAGTRNFKRAVPQEVEVLRKCQQYSPKAIHLCVTQLAESCGVQPPVPSAPKTAFDLLPNNLEKTYDLVPFDPIIRGCRQILQVAADGGKTSGQSLWYHSLSITRLCLDSDKASLFISNKWPGFDRAGPQGMDFKLQQLAAGNYGPALCTTFDKYSTGDCKGICQNCPHWNKITSPIALGRKAPPQSAEPPVVDVEDEGETIELRLPSPPFPYTRRATGGIVMMQGKNEEDAEPVMIYEYDMYPVRRMVNERREVEETVWRVKIPIVGWSEVTVPQAQLAEATGLHSLLMSKGVYVHPARIKLMVSFMVAYITQLQKESRTEQLFAKLGFREDNSVFVLGDRSYRPGGVVEHHPLSDELKNDVPGLCRKGTLEGWKDAIQFYNAAGHEAHRFMLYGAFGSPLLHMTGHLGVIVNASGPSGAGKTRCLFAINSVWGHPQTLGTSGSKDGATSNARTALLSVYNNLPFCIDEITYLPNKDLGALCMMHTQGRGKVRAVRSGAVSKVVETWANMIFASGNTDAYVALMQNRRDAEAEVMRVLQIPFVLPKTYTEKQADAMFQNGLMQNYGHAAHVYAPYLVDKYAKIQDTVRAVVAKTAERAHMAVAERFQSGAIGAIIVGAMVARKQGLLDDFPIERDWEWAIDQVAGVKAAIQEHHATPKDILAEFLDSRVGETLVISDTIRSNIAPRLDRIPRGALTIRHETDTGLVYMLKSEFKRHCVETGANYGAIQERLAFDNILLDNDAKKVLGAGTDMSGGQVRCWVINVKELQK